MVLAFVPAGAAGRCTSLELVAEQRWVSRALTREQPSGGFANICTIQIQPNAGNQVPNIFFGQAGVRTTHAGLSAIHAGPNALLKYVMAYLPRLRMRFDHIVDVVHLSPRFSRNRARSEE
jgi:hypothetical protein